MRSYMFIKPGFLSIFGPNIFGSETNNRDRSKNDYTILALPSERDSTYFAPICRMVNIESAILVYVTFHSGTSWNGPDRMGR